ncbi:steroidogenic acute regulatory protein-like [Agrilus planipennis]|uniref:Steroidogenic acute regulatory protein-like n=1 Tax=Agrilus planipennis TaxID=224129 RepID=A0A7F5R549_AGRPL|nr:steroidogenic acute regulatory protein-like [Agrilus planipennis]XP_025830774.1 steroidogenic acute regulatory protein-like [Agrilus planipennis]
MMPEYEIRNAAEAILRSSSSHQQIQTPDISHSHSINTIPSIRTEYVISEDLLGGQRIDGKMSSIRRFFCLFVTFDLAFTTLMWIICITLSGKDLTVAIENQIIRYNIHSSLFDVVMVALCRFLVLLLFYGFFYINHWVIISVSTFATCAFLITKVFFYTWTNSSQPVFEVLLILTSFVISWGETWFFDFRVIPQELNAQRLFVSGPETERTPLIRNYLQNLPSMYTESVGNFYSPLGSPEGSLHGVEGLGRYPVIKLSQEKEEEYKSKGAELLRDVWKLCNCTEWKLEKETDNKDCLYSMNFCGRKIFKLSAIIDIPPRCLLEELYYKVESIPKWNPSLLESHKVQSFDEYTDISYQVSTDSGGVVASRDFVTLRHWGIIDETYVIAYDNTEHQSVPKNEKYIRGENGIGCWIMKPINGDPSKCHFLWVLNTNLKGWIPKVILDTVLPKVMLDYIKDLRRHVTKLNESGRIT